MAARILSTLIFWVLMIPIILGSIVIVLLLYLPFVALKALWLTVTGRLNEAVGAKAGEDDGSQPRPHIG